MKSTLAPKTLVSFLRLEIYRFWSRRDTKQEWKKKTQRQDDGDVLLVIGLMLCDQQDWNNYLHSWMGANEKKKKYINGKQKQLD